jgi:hypothetical protein
VTMADFGAKGFATIEPGNGTQEEAITFTGITQNANGTATLTGVANQSFVAPYTETSGLAVTHPGGVIMIITNTAGYYNRFANKDDDETIAGTWTFTNPNYPQMDTATPAPTLDAQLATKKYVDDTAVAGAPNATTGVKGIVQLATQAQTDAGTATGSTGAAIVATPAVTRSRLLSDYVADTGAADAYAIAPSPVISAYTTGQIFTFKAANTNTTTSTLNVNTLGTKTIKKTSGNNLAAGDILAGQIVMVEYDGTNFQLISSIAPEGATKSGVQNQSYTYGVDSVGTDAYAVTLSPTPTLTAGLTVTFKAGTANTGAATLNVNSLGAVSIVKKGNVALNTGDILSGQTVTVTYDGTNFQMQSSQSLPFYGLSASGSTNKNLADASTTQTIAHGLGITPKVFDLFSGTGVGTTYSFSGSSASFGSTDQLNTATFVLSSGNGAGQSGVVSADATNISIVWTKTGSPTGTSTIIWSAFA